MVVEVSANAPVSATLTLKYMVRSAGWSPSYDIRVVDITKAMQLTYKAQVYQNTGEDWDKVQLALSSGDPNKDAIMPQLYPWRLDFGNRTASRTNNRTAAYNAGIRDVRGSSAMAERENRCPSRMWSSWMRTALRSTEPQQILTVTTHLRSRRMVDRSASASLALLPWTNLSRVPR